jgi:hypothetical protein
MPMQAEAHIVRETMANAHTASEGFRKFVLRDGRRPGTSSIIANTLRRIVSCRNSTRAAAELGGRSRWSREGFRSHIFASNMVIRITV